MLMLMIPLLVPQVTFILPEFARFAKGPMVNYRQ